VILAIDIGNSNIVLSVFHNGKWTKTFRYETKQAQPELYYEIALRNILLEWEIHVSDINHALLSSVVPYLNPVVTEAVWNVTGLKIFTLGPDVFKKLDIYIPHPYEIGADLVCNAYAALTHYHEKVIIVDFGTALSFTIASRQKGIEGVTIAPGLKTAIYALSTQTAQLPAVPLELPDSAIGQNTTSAIQAGVLWGYVGLVKELIHRIQAEERPDYKVVATGGLSSILAPLESEFDFLDKMLTLEGLRLIYLHQSANQSPG
jgi:type III pantothenate kinase